MIWRAPIRRQGGSAVPVWLRVGLTLRKKPWAFQGKAGLRGLGQNPKFGGSWGCGELGWRMPSLRQDAGNGGKRGFDRGRGGFGRGGRGGGSVGSGDEAGGKREGGGESRFSGPMPPGE